MFCLTDEQKSFLAFEGKATLSACPGSGKTFIVGQKMLQYMKDWNRPHQGVAVLSFTNVARDEIEKQISMISSGEANISYPHYVGTLDSFINNCIMLRFGYLMLAVPRRPIIVIKDALSFPYGYWRSECYRRVCVEGVQGFSWGIDGKLYRENKPVECLPNAGRKEAPCYELKRTLLKKGYIFQGEVPTLSYFLLRKYPLIASAIAARFPVMILDEAQDTSEEQMAVLDVICSHNLESMILVGDSDQSIYEWRNATPECFNQKRVDPDWERLVLTSNFRSSQLICNATKAFAYTLERSKPNTAAGINAAYHQKPILFLVTGDIKKARDIIIEKFLNLCTENGIVHSPDSIAVVTRGRIYRDTDVQGLWKSKQVEVLAESAFEWFAGSRSKAYELCEKAIYSLCVGELRDVETTIELSINSFMPSELWRAKVIEVLLMLPNINLPLDEWINRLRSAINQVLQEVGLAVREGLVIDNVIKIKSRDQKSPEFKSIPIRRFFENKSRKVYTLSSIHGVKGETFDALLLLVESVSKNTVSPSFLNTGDLNTELMRIAYVAMTRPRKLLVVSMPHRGREEVLPRFPQTAWDYRYISM